MKLFNDSRLYTPKQRQEIAGCALQTQANERWRGTGPRYVKRGSKILYPGDALNEFYGAQIVDPVARAAAREEARSKAKDKHARLRRARRIDHSGAA